MKYTIEGFSQKNLIELKLDTVDAIILRYVVDFWSTGKMVKILHDGKEFFWLKYSSVLEEIPIINITNKQALAKRFAKYVAAGIMEHYTHKKGGTYSCYRFTEKYEILISDSYSKESPLPLKSPTPYHSKA